MASFQGNNIGASGNRFSAIYLQKETPLQRLQREHAEGAWEKDKPRRRTPPKRMASRKKSAAAPKKAAKK